MVALTDRQQEILTYIRLHASNRGYWPSIREIQAHFRFRSTNAVAGHLRALEHKHAITRVPGHARAYRLVGDPAFVGAQTMPGDASSGVMTLPVYGQIAAGYPDGVEPGVAIAEIQVPSSFGLRPQRRPFALKVRGDSMQDAGIEDGDVVIVEPREPRHREIVAALIDGATTLKRFIAPGDCPPYLKAENPAYPDIHPVAELIIQGVATSVVRRLA